MVVLPEADGPERPRIRGGRMTVVRADEEVVESKGLVWLVGADSEGRG